MPAAAARGLWHEERHHLLQSALIDVVAIDVDRRRATSQLRDVYGSARERDPCPAGSNLRVCLDVLLFRVGEVTVTSVPRMPRGDSTTNVEELVQDEVLALCAEAV